MVLIRFLMMQEMVHLYIFAQHFFDLSYCIKFSKRKFYATGHLLLQIVL